MLKIDEVMQIKYLQKITCLKIFMDKIRIINFDSISPETPN